MRLLHATADQYIYFVAVDATDLKTRETGLSGFAVSRSRNGGTPAAYSTPTVTEVSSSLMPGVYKLLVDEDVSMATLNATEEMVLHITHSSIAPVTRVIELFKSEWDRQKGSHSISNSFGAGVDAAVVSMNGGVITNFAFADNAIDVDVVADGFIDDGKFATSAITAASIANSAINSDKIAASAATEIATRVWQLATSTSTVTESGSFGEALTDISAPAIADAVWNEDVTGHQAVGTFGQAGQNHIRLPSGMHRVVRAGACSGTGTGVYVYLDATASPNNDHYNGMKLIIYSGTGAVATTERSISAYVGSTRRCTVTSGTGTSTDSRFIVYESVQDPDSIADHVWNEARSSHTITGTYGSQVNALVVGMNGDVVTNFAIADGAIDADVLAADTITAAKIADNAIATEHLATGAITADTMATGSIDAAALSNDANVEIATSVWKLATSTTGTTSAGTFGKVLTDVSAGNIADAVWDEVRGGHTTSGTYGSQVDARVTAMNADVLTAAAIDDGAIGAAAIAEDAIGSSELATTAVNEIVDQVWNELRSAHTISGSYGSQVNALVVGMNADVLTAAAIDDGAIGAAAIAADAIGASELATSAVNEIVDQVWNELRSAHTITGSYGSQVNALVVGMNADVITAASINDGAIGAAAIATDAIGSDELAETAVNEIVDQVWNELRSAHTISGSYGSQQNALVVGMNSNVITGAAVHADAVTKIQAGLATEAKQNTIDGIVDDILVDTGTTLPATLATIDGIVDDILVDTGTTLPATLATIDGIVDDILVDTGTTLPATLTTIDNFLDTEIAAILADTVELQTDWANGGRLDLLIDQILADTNELQADNVPGLISGLNNISTTEVNTQVDTALADINLNHLMKEAAVDADVVDNSVIAQMAASGSTADWSTFVNTTDSLQAIRVRGDGSWTTGAGGSSPTEAEIYTYFTASSRQNTFKADVSALSTVTTTQVGAEVDASLADIHLDHLLSLEYTGQGHAESLLRDLTESDGGTYRFTSNALEEAPSGTGASASTIATAVWDRATSGHTTSGTFGEQVKTDIDGILAVIGAAGAGLTEAGATGNHLSAIPWNAAWDAEVQSEVADALIAINLNHLMKEAALDADITTNSVIGQLAATNGNFANFNKDEDSLQSIKDNAAWNTGNTTTPPTVAAIRSEMETSAGMLFSVDAIADKLDTALEADGGGGDWQFTSSGLENAPSGTGASAATIFDHFVHADQLTAFKGHVATALADIYLDQLIATSYDSADPDGSGASLLNELTSNDGGNTRFTTAALALAPTGGSAPTVGAIRAEMDSNSTQLAAILLDTGTTLPGTLTTIDGIVDAILLDTGTTLDGKLNTIDTNVDQIEAAVITNAAGTDIAADIIAIKAETVLIVADTDELQSDDVPGLISALNDISTTQVNAQVDSALADIHLDKLLAANYDPASKPGVATALLNEVVENDGGVSRFTANALELAPTGSGGGATAAAVADAVWDEGVEGHLNNGSFGAMAHGGIIRQAGTRGVLRSGSAQAGATLSITLDAGASTSNDFYNGLDLIVTAGTGISNTRVPITDYVGSTKVATVASWPSGTPDDTSKFQILYPPVPTRQGLGVLYAATATKSDTTHFDLIDGLHSTEDDAYNDCIAVFTDVVNPSYTEVRRITDYVASNRRITLDVALPATIDTGDYLTILPALPLNKIGNNAITSASLASSAVEEIIDAFIAHRGTAAGGASGSITLAGTASTTANFYRDGIITLVGGTGAGQSRRITGYSVAKVADVEPDWATNPVTDNTKYVITGDGRPRLRSIDQLTLDGISTTLGTAGAGLTDLGGMSTGMKAAILVEALKVLQATSMPEPGAGVPSSAPNLDDAIMYLYGALRNKLTVTEDFKTFHSSSDLALYKKPLADDGDTFTESESATV